MSRRFLNRGSAFVGLILMPVLFVGACGGSQTGSSQSVSIGAAMPLSGPDAVLGVPIANGVKLAVKDANTKGGLPGTLTAVTEDDQEKPEVGATVARKFCSTTGMIGVVGDLASSVTLGTQVVYNGCDLVQITPSASNDTLTHKGYKNFFRTTAVNSDQATKAVDFIAKNLPNVKKVATVDGNDATTAQIANQFKSAGESKGMQTVSQVHVTPNTTNFRGALTSLIAAKPDLIYIALFVNDGALAVKQSRELGFKGLFFGIDSDVTPDFIKLAGPANAEGVYMSNLGYDPLATPSAKAFVDSYKATYGSDPNTYAANAYDAATAIIAAWKAAGSSDRKKIVAAMPSVSFTGTLGMVAFNENGDLTQPTIGIFQVKSGQIAFIGPA